MYSSNTRPYHSKKLINMTTLIRLHCVYFSSFRKKAFGYRTVIDPYEREAIGAEGMVG
jgi:hypothetical protein